MSVSRIGPGAGPELALTPSEIRVADANAMAGGAAASDAPDFAAIFERQVADASRRRWRVVSPTIFTAP